MRSCGACCGLDRADGVACQAQREGQSCTSAPCTSQGLLLGKAPVSAGFCCLHFLRFAAKAHCSQHFSCPCQAQQSAAEQPYLPPAAPQALFPCCVQAPEKQKECEELLGPMGNKFDHLAAVARLINDYTNPDAADEGPRGQGDEGALDKDIGVAVEFERDSDEDEGGSMEEVMVGLVLVHLLQTLCCYAIIFVARARSW